MAVPTGAFSTEPVTVKEGFPRPNEQFRILPFRRLADGSVQAGERAWYQYPKWRLAILLGLDRLMAAEVDVINLSIGSYEAYGPDDPMQHATKFAIDRNTPVVVAAGNEGPRRDSLQELARVPWTISVGATDLDGRLLKSSSRGVPNGNGPTVVSAGHSVLDASMKGTSFAAPRVSRVIGFTLKCLEFSTSNLRAHLDGTWRRYSAPINLVTIGLADDGLDVKKLREGVRNPVNRLTWKDGPTRVLSRTERERGWYGSLYKWLADAKIPCSATLGVTSVRRALQLMARPLRDYSQHEVGWGFVGDEEAKSFFLGLLPSIWLRIFSPNVVATADPESLKKLDERLGPLWDANMVNAMMVIFMLSQRIWSVRVVGKAEELSRL